LPQFTGRLKAAAVGLDDGLGDGQPKTDPPGGRGAGLVGAVEALEDVRQVFRADPFAGVRDHEHGSVSLGGDFHRHAAAGPVVVDGVADEVRDDLAKLFCVGFAVGGCQSHGQVKLLRLSEGAQDFHGFAGDLAQVATPARGGRFRGIQPGQRQQRLGEPAHPLGSALAGREGFAASVAETFTRQPVLRVHEDDGDGRAEFVRGVGREAGLSGEGVIEPAERGVEHADKLP